MFRITGGDPTLYHRGKMRRNILSLHRRALRPRPNERVWRKKGKKR